MDLWSENLGSTELQSDPGFLCDFEPVRPPVWKAQLPSTELQTHKNELSKGLPWELRWESASNMGDLGSIPGLGRSSGGGHGNPLWYPCLENPHGQRSLAGYGPWGCKLEMTE